LPRLVPARFLAALRPDESVPFELPSAVTRESRRRVQVAALLGSLGYGIFLTLLLSLTVEGSPLRRSIDVSHDVTGLVTCLLLLVVAMARPIPDRHVLRIALVVQVVLSAMISIAVTWSDYLRTGHGSSLTWVVPIIILFPLLVPVAPRTTLWVSILCALTIPGGLWLLAARGAIEASASDYWHAFSNGGVAVTIATVAARTVRSAHQQAAAARTVGSYELLERLGLGGMGEVWKARHLFLARPAAVKLILPESLQGPMEERDAVVKRFMREAQVTASLRSPHTVELFDFGVAADGTFYYAMELLEGMNLEQFVYQFGAIEPRRAVHWLVQACHSIGEAHARGLVHRDIKPGNLFICRYGRDADFVKVLDFGLTRAAASSRDATLTTPGAKLGTPGYMPPEQVYGLEIDQRTDLYALGCVGYWLLAGEKPFESEHAGELLRLHAQAIPPPLSSKARQAIPARIEAALMACLSKDPDQRPQSADQLCEALDAAADGSPWSAREADKWWAENMSLPRQVPPPRS
jgi:tRNA A-37 threonylcarbamoyl transferase component Bud32